MPVSEAGRTNWTKEDDVSTENNSRPKTASSLQRRRERAAKALGRPGWTPPPAPLHTAQHLRGRG
jgi:hypothetical protein